MHRSPPSAAVEDTSFSDLNNSTICSICGIPIPNFIPEYFWGEPINPACTECNKHEDYLWDPYASFPNSEMPVSLCSHWLPPTSFTSGNTGTISSLRSHYLLLPNPDDSFVTAMGMLEELKLMMAKDREEMKADCKQS